MTSLFERASQIQKGLGCDENKLRVIGNGVHYERFVNIPAPQTQDWVNIGAVVRIAKIKGYQDNDLCIHRIEDAY